MDILTKIGLNSCIAMAIQIYMWIYYLQKKKLYAFTIAGNGHEYCTRGRRDKLGMPKNTLNLK